MYIVSGSILIIGVLFLILFHCKKRQAARKICEMEDCQKLCLLDRLAEPFGFSYLPCPDIMTSRLDAWQRKFGYQALFDRSAPHFNMVIDCEPIYFDYADKTWLIEFWKGQYGLSAGAEIGVYTADSILSPSQYETAHFHSVPDREMLPLSMELYCKNQRMFSVSRIHWWLTGFCVGTYAAPEELRLRASLTFPSFAMLESFTKALLEKGYEKCDISIRNLSVSFSFISPHPSAYDSRFPHSSSTCGSHLSRLSFASPSRLFPRARLAKILNRLLCQIFRLITRPFTCTPDRLLYLYYFLPSAFRRTMYFHKNKYRKKNRPKCRMNTERGCSR